MGGQHFSVLLRHGEVWRFLLKQKQERSEEGGEMAGVIVVGVSEMSVSRCDLEDTVTLDKGETIT